MAVDLRNQRRLRVPRRRSRDTWLPLVALGAGLLIVRAVVRHEPSISVSYLRQFRATRGTYDVGFWVDTDISSWDPFLAGRLTALTILLMLAYLTSVAAIGAPVVRALEGGRRWPRPAAALAGFIPGYLMVLGPLQILFAAVPLHTAARVALAAVPLWALLTHRRAFARSGTSVRTPSRTVARRLLFTASVMLGVLLVAGLHRLQAGHFYLFQDSIRWFVSAGQWQIEWAGDGYLAQWKQQSDEWVFAAPLMFYNFSAPDFALMIYTTSFVSLASFFCLTYSLVARFARRRGPLAGAVAVSAVFGATTSIIPTEYVTIPGGDFPVLGIGHPGRLIGIVLPWVVAVLWSRRLDLGARVALALALVGLGFTSIHLLGSCVLTLVACLLWQVAMGQAAPPRVATHVAIAVVRIGPFVALALIFYTFAALARTDDPSSVAWWLVGAMGVALASAASVLVVTRDPFAIPRARPGRSLAAALGTMAAGLTIANNLTADILGGRVREALGAVLPGYQDALLTRPDLVPNLLAGLHFPRFSAAACDRYYVQCHTFGGFMVAYGVLLATAVATWFALGPITADPRTNARRYAWLLMVALLAGSLLVLHFTGITDSNSANILGRVGEAPVYGLLALAAITLAESRSRLTAYGGLAFLSAWVVIPLVSTGWTAQMMDNATWVLQRTGVS